MSGTVTRLPVDPDLERALVELASVAHRLAVLEEQILLPEAQSSYTAFGRLVGARDEAHAAIASRAAQLNLSPGALRLFVQQASRFRATAARKPNLAQLQRDVIRARDALREHKRERDADQAIAAFRARSAGYAVDAADEAVSYLEACRG